MKKAYYTLPLLFVLIGTDAWASKGGPSDGLLQKIVTWKNKAFEEGLQEQKDVAPVITLIDKAIATCRIKIKDGKIIAVDNRYMWDCDMDRTAADTAMRKLNLSDTTVLARLKVAEPARPRSSNPEGPPAVAALTARERVDAKLQARREANAPSPEEQARKEALKAKLSERIQASRAKKQVNTVNPEAAARKTAGAAAGRGK